MCPLEVMNIVHIKGYLNIYLIVQTSDSNDTLSMKVIPTVTNIFSQGSM